MAVSVAEWDRAHLWHYRARLPAIHDGDTIYTLNDTGYRGRHEPHLRIAGLTAPELWTPEGPAARAAMGAALRYAADVPWPLRVVSLQRETVISEVTSFERYVSDVLVALPDGTLRDVKELL